MKAKETFAYFNQIKVNIRFSGVMSETADACIVPQYDNCASLSGVSAAFIHSPAASRIIEFQNYIKEKKKLMPNEVYCTSGNKNYQYLIHTPVLRTPQSNFTPSIKTIIETCTFSAIECASKKQAKSIVIPSMNTGKNGILTYKNASHAILAAIKRFSTLDSSINEVTIAIINEKAFVEYSATLAAIQLTNCSTGANN